MARRLAPLQRRRGLAALADALGIEVEQTHRALPDAETCARVFCALFARLTRARRHDRRGGRAARAAPRRRRAARRARARAGGRPSERPDLSALPRDPGVYVFRDADGHPLYVGKSVCLRTRARAHFTTPAEWTGEAEHVDYQATQSELGALLLEDRLIKALRPPGNTRGKRQRRRLRLPPLPARHRRSRSSRSRSSRRAGTRSRVGPVRGRAAAAELVEQLNSLFGLRHCGRRLPRREHPSAYGQMGRCLSPCLGDLDPNLYRERLDAALRLFVDRRDGGAALLAHIDGQRSAAVAAQQLRARRLAAAAARAAGGAAAPARRAAARRARRRAAGARAAPGGARALRRVLDRGRAGRRLGRRCRRTPAELAGAQRRRAARRSRGRSSAAGCRPTRSPSCALVGAWLAAHEPPALELDERAVEGDAIARWVRSVAAAPAAPDAQRSWRGRVPRYAITLSSPSRARSRGGSGAPRGVGRSMLIATTCVTGRSVSAPIR